MGEPGLPRECQQDALWSCSLQCLGSYMQALDSQVREPANSMGLLSLELVGGACLTRKAHSPNPGSATAWPEPPAR